MSHPSSRSVVISAAVLGLLAGCNGGGDDADAGPPQRSMAETTSTTAPAPEIDLSQPIPGGSLHGTPRPPLVNTGDDYVAIVESLVANFRWLTENPDVLALDALYVPGTGTHTFQVDFFTELANNGWRSADDGYYLVSVEVVDANSDAVSIRFSDSFEFERIVDATGTQVGEGRPRDPTVRTWNALLSPDADGRWRFAEVVPTEDDTVQL